MSSTYNDQFERVKRYLSRFKEINDGKTHYISSPNYDDDIYAFFQNCYHLKDWIKNDPACTGWASVENLISSNTDLSICADLCNALKHLSLTRPRSTENPSFSGGHVTINITDGFGVQEKVDISIKYTVATKSGDIDAFQLAERCVSAWEQFINNQA
jgi:hypothetical protein